METINVMIGIKISFIEILPILCDLYPNILNIYNDVKNDVEKLYEFEKTLDKYVDGKYGFAIKIYNNKIKYDKIYYIMGINICELNEYKLFNYSVFQSIEDILSYKKKLSSVLENLGVNGYPINIHYLL